MYGGVEIGKRPNLWVLGWLKLKGIILSEYLYVFYKCQIYVPIEMFKSRKFKEWFWFNSNVIFILWGKSFKC